MPNTDNPLQGTGLSENEATDAIRNILNPSVEGQSAAEAASVEDNPEPQGKEEPDATAPEAEPDAEVEEGQGEEDATPDTEAEAQEAAPDDDDFVDMPETLNGLAELLELDANALNDLTVTVKNDGKSREIPLKEALDGYQRLEDYRTKTATLADEKKAFQPEKDAIAAERKHYADTIGPMVQQIQQRLAQDDAKLVKMLDPDSTSYNPEGYVVEKARLDGERAQATLLQQEHDRIAQQHQAEAHQKFQADIMEHEQALLNAHPEWAKNPDKAKTDIETIRAYAVSQGAPKELIDREYRSYALTIAEKAMKWDKAQERKPAIAKKVRKLPKTVKSGPKQEKASPEVTQHRVNLSNLRKSGNVRDAAKLFRDGGYLTR